jgi:hypothetical protein
MRANEHCFQKKTLRRIHGVGNERASQLGRRSPVRAGRTIVQDLAHA